MAMTDEMLLAQVDAFLERTKMAPTRFGVETLGDGGLLKGMREGRSLSLRNANKLLDFMAAYGAPDPTKSEIAA